MRRNGEKEGKKGSQSERKLVGIREKIVNKDRID